ncbi:hypothetical protein BJV82DRAFT_681679 [Fennellomyces sp. T-0311]|nr:hypothetical protein BJV82DRAFT_681679 [Fennellomyces sp. T-0311]
MINDPEIPYDREFDTPEEEDWRDLRIVAYNSHTELYNSSQRQLPDDNWLFPPEFTVEAVLGINHRKLNEIRRDTSASLQFNEPLRQIDIWGDRDSVKRARHMLDLIVERLQQHSDATKPKSRKWGKADRKLTKKEQKRANRKLAQQMENLNYRQYPDEPFQYKAIVPFPDKSIPPRTIFGSRNEYLNRLCAECKCYMRYNESMNVVELTHNIEASVIKAAERMRNWYLSVCRTPSTSVVHILKQPSNNMVVQFRALPPDFTVLRYASPAQEQKTRRHGRLLEGLTTGIIIDQIYDDMDSTNADYDLDQRSISSELSNEIKELDEANAKKMKTALEVGLESIRLMKWDIRMKLYFGHVVVTQYPRNNTPRTLEHFVNKTLASKNFTTKFAPSIAERIEDLEDVFAWLTHHCTEYTYSPNTSYIIEARQSPSLVEKISENRQTLHRKLVKDHEQWNTTLIVNFTSEKRVGVWRCLVEQLDITTIQSADLQDDYDWELKLQRAVNMSKDETRSSTPHGLFVDNLELNQESDRLVYLPNCLCYSPQLITQKKKWIYAYTDDWTIELIRDEIWDINLLNIPPGRHYLPVDLSMYEPQRTIFRLAMYREQWKSRLSENAMLELGEAPSWTPTIFLKNPNDEKETLESIVDAAQTVKRALNQK